MQDLRFAIRTLLRTPTFFLVSVLCLALGIGANSAIFSVVKGVLLDPLPFRNPDSLVLLYEGREQAEKQFLFSSPANFLDWKARSKSFRGMTSYYQWAVNLTGVTEPERLKVAFVSQDYFQTLGVEALVGRSFTTEDYQKGRDRLIVLTDQFWRRRFGGDPTTIGKLIQIDDQPRVVIGVMPPGLVFPAEIDAWLPDVIDPAEASRGSREVSVIARLRPGVSVEQARAEMTDLSSVLAAEYPEADANFRAYTVPLKESIVGDVRPVLLVLLGGVGFVLLVACANITNLLLARSVAREREIALRTAVGAGRWRLIRQLLTESLVLSLLGGILGLLLAFWGVRLIVLSSPKQMIPRLEQIGIDGGVLVFALLVSLLTGLIAGFAPAWRASRPDLNRSLKDRSADSTGGFSGGLTSLRMLVVLEITLSLVLLIGAGLMVKSFVRLQEVDPGFNPKQVARTELFLPSSRYPKPVQQTAFFTQLLERLRSLPGVRSASGAAFLPLSGNLTSRRFLIDGQPVPPKAGEEPMAVTNTIATGFLETLDIPVLRGRAFSAQDTANSPPVTLISQSMARRFWPATNPVGQRIRFVRSRDPQPNWMTVVGVVGDTRTRLSEEPADFIYTPYAQNPIPFLVLVLRTEPEPLSLASGVRTVIREMDRNLPVSKLTTLEQYLADSISRPRFSAMLVGILSALALVLAMAGVYGVMSYIVSQRVLEIGIRLTLGAQRGDVLRMVVRQGVTLALVGVILGLLAAFALTRLLESLLFEVSIKDPVVFLTLPLALLAVALVASYLPARRATRIDPIEAIRYG